MHSHYFGVGSIVSWAEPGVGAIANQSVPGPGYGACGLALMRDGVSAPETLRRLLSADEQESMRQLAVVDHHGRVAVHTGARCIAHAGHRVADGVSAQANIMERPTVPDAMVEAYLAGPGDLADRLLAALEAAEAEGGDLRGRQSAACGSSPRRDGPRTSRRRSPRSTCGWRITAIRYPSLAASWRHGGPTVASRWPTSWRQAATSTGAFAEYTAAHESQPDNAELAFWRGVALASRGREDEARPFLGAAYAGTRAGVSCCAGCQPRGSFRTTRL